MNMKTRFTSKKAKIISVIIYTLSVSVFAVILGVYFMNYWHPRAGLYFQKKYNDSSVT